MSSTAPDRMLSIPEAEHISTLLIETAWTSSQTLAPLRPEDGSSSGRRQQQQLFVRERSVLRPSDVRMLSVSLEAGGGL